MTIDEMIAVLQAFKAGKAIQFKAKDFKPWYDETDPDWDFSNIEYRVKPEPRVLWILRNSLVNHSANTLLDAWTTPACASAEYVKFVEVIDD